MIGRVYKIIVSCSNEIYIGSTQNELRHRWQEHKQQYRSWKDGKKYGAKTSSFELFDKWGIENCKIVLIKEYEVVDKRHLEVYEQIWVNKLRPINKNNPFYIERLYNKQKYQNQLQKNPNHNKEKYQKELKRNPNRGKERYQKTLQRNPNHNKEKYQNRLQQNPDYCKDLYQKTLQRNPDYCKDLYQKVLQNNPDYCKEQYKKKLKRNPNLNKEKIVCECGLEINKKSHARHKKTKKHTNRLLALQT